MLAVIFEPVRIIIVVGGQEFVPAGFLGGDHAAQFGIRIDQIADKVDAPHMGHWPFGNLEDQINAVLRLFRHLGGNGGGKMARLAIERDDALHIRLDPGSGEDGTRLGLDLVAQLVLLESAVVFKNHPVDDRVFNHRNDQGRALLANGHIGKQARGKKRFQ